MGVKQAKNHVYLTVGNSGVEISPEERERIFEQSYRIPYNALWQYGGTGLGLTLVKKLAELLEVSIKVERDCNYTQFTAFFPISDREIVLFLLKKITTTGEFRKK